MFFSNVGSGTSSDTSLYEELGVEKTSTTAEIKRAYKKMALKYHPDRNKSPEAEERFKKISSAYEILSDQDKRSSYDRFGLDAVKGGSGMPPGFGGGGGNPFDMFENLFGAGPGMRTSQSRRQRQGRSIVKEIEVDIKDIYNEKKLNLSMNTQVKCTKCNGSGCKPGSTPISCQKCDGSGMFVRIQQFGPGMISQSTQTCDACLGKGKIISPNDKCKACNGSKIEKKRSRVELKLSKTNKDGDKIVFNERADYDPEATVQGDLIIILKEKNKEQKFIRLENDLLYEKSISLIEALCGLTLVIKHLDGRELFIKTTEVIQPESIFKISGEGMTNKHDLFVKFSVVLPNTLSDERKQYIQKLIQRNTDTNLVEDSYDKEIKFLDVLSPQEILNTKERINNVSATNSNNTSNLYEEDDSEDGVPGCAQQ